MTEAFPLAWPIGRPRSSICRRALFHRRIEHGSTNRKRKVEVNLYQAISSVRNVLKHMRANNVIISTNIPTRQDGLPYLKTPEPNDHGAAVYFRLDGSAHCLACDRWDRVADNLCAITHHIQAIRAMDRWGVGDLAQAFAGYKALPPMEAKKAWWVLLGFEQPPADVAIVQAKWRSRIAEVHPDRGGNANQAAEINAAMTEAECYYETRKMI
jgi:hypothetical protein